MQDTRSRKANPGKDGALTVIYIVDGDSRASAALRGLLEEAGKTVVTFATGEAFLAGFRPAGEACLLVDADLAEMGSIALLRRIGTDGHRLPAILIADGSDLRIAVEAIKAGAVDFIEKPVSRDALLAGIASALEQAKDRTKAATWREAAAVNVAGLTKRQREILDRVLAGQPSKNIAADLGLSQRTVENHRAAILRRTGTRSLAGLARVALAATWGEPATAPQTAPPAGPPGGPMDAVLATPGLADVLDTEQFRRFFDQIPLAIVISEIEPSEVIIYANPAFAALTGQTVAAVEGQGWTVLAGLGSDDSGVGLGDAITATTDFVGSFRIAQADGTAATVDAYSNVIEDEDGTPTFRLAALVDVGGHDAAQRESFEARIAEKDRLLMAVQQRVKNNLQMITALVRIKARQVQARTDAAPLDRFAERIDSIQNVYRLLSELETADSIDLGVYLSEIVSAVMRARAVEGIRLDMKLDSYPVSVNVALPTGLVVNEVMMNALAHAFAGRDGGTITLHSLSDNGGCRVLIADDGVGFPPGVQWPGTGKLGELIVRSLRQNARADLQVESTPGKGTRVTIGFTRAAAAPEA
jgi:PAS domain S-box-containing protein